MADNERELKIKLTGDAASLVGATRQAGKALGDVKAGITDGVAPALANLGQEVGGSSKKSEDLKSVLKGLQSEFPMLSSVARLAMNPIAGAVFAVTLAYTAWKAVVDGVFERMNTGTGGGSFAGGLGEIKKAVADSAVEFGKYKRALAEVAAAEATVQENSEKATAAVRAKAVAIAESQDAQKALNLAKINLDEAQGRISGPQAIMARVAVEDRAAQQKLRQNQEAREEENEVKRKELEQLRLGAYNEEQSVEPLKKKADEAATALSRNEMLLTESKKTKAEVDKQVKAIDTAPFLGPGMLEQGRAARALRSQLNVRIGDAEAAKPELADQAKATAERYEAAKSRALGLRGAATKLGRDLPGMESDAAQLSANENEIVRKERLTRNYGAGAQLTQDAKQGQQRQDELKQQMIKSARSGGSISAEVLAAFKAQEAQNAHTAKAISDYARRIRDLEGRPPRTQ